MSLATIIALLQSALLLLTMAQSAPNLPQSLRDNAIAVAQQAISAASVAVMTSATASPISSPVPTHTVPPTPNPLQSPAEAITSPSAQQATTPTSTRPVNGKFSIGLPRGSTNAAIRSVTGGVYATGLIDIAGFTSAHASSTVFAYDSFTVKQNCALNASFYNFDMSHIEDRTIANTCRTDADFPLIGKYMILKYSSDDGFVESEFIFQ